MEWESQRKDEDGIDGATNDRDREDQRRAQPASDERRICSLALLFASRRQGAQVTVCSVSCARALELGHGHGRMVEEGSGLTS